MKDGNEIYLKIEITNRDYPKESRALLIIQRSPSVKCGSSRQVGRGNYVTNGQAASEEVKIEKSTLWGRAHQAQWWTIGVLHVVNCFIDRDYKSWACLFSEVWLWTTNICQKSVKTNKISITQKYLAQLLLR